MFNNNPVVNEYIWSSLITFVAAFGAAILPFVGNVPIDQAAIFAVIAVGARAGTKAVLNLLASKGQTASSLPQ